MSSGDLGWIVALLCAAVSFVAALGWWWASTRGRRGVHRRQGVARAGESAAERLLERYGYTIEDRQVSQAWTLWVDGEPLAVTARADLLVRKHGRTYVAEVKTGTRAPDPKHPPTRRQLLEYSVVFDVDGVLLVDMEHEHVMLVEFP